MKNVIIISAVAATALAGSIEKWEQCAKGERLRATAFWSNEIVS